MKQNNVTRLRWGQVLIEVDKKAHSDNLLRSKMTIDVPMRVSAHKSLNYKKKVSLDHETWRHVVMRRFRSLTPTLFWKHLDYLHCLIVSNWHIWISLWRCTFSIPWGASSVKSSDTINITAGGSSHAPDVAQRVMMTLPVEHLNVV